MVQYIIGWEGKNLPLINGSRLEYFRTEVPSGSASRPGCSLKHSFRLGSRVPIEVKALLFHKYGVEVELIEASSYEEAKRIHAEQSQKALQAQAKVAQATAEADQVVATAKGDAQAIRLKGAALRDNPQVLTLDSINAINPKATVIICTGTGQGNCPSIVSGSFGGSTDTGGGK